MKANRFSARRQTAARNCSARGFHRSLLSLFDPQAGSLLDQTGYTQPVMFALEYDLGQCSGRVGGSNLSPYWAQSRRVRGGLRGGRLHLGGRHPAYRPAVRPMQPCRGADAWPRCFATEQQVTAVLEPYRDQIAIAALNGPESIVISGDAWAVNAVMTGLEKTRRQVEAADHLARLPFGSGWIRCWTPCGKPPRRWPIRSQRSTSLPT